jgi:hypothetical protein
MYFCCNSKSLEERQHKQPKKKVVKRKEGISKEFVASINKVGDGTRSKEESKPNWCQEKTRGS